MEIIDCLQGSDQWVKARLGVVTASHFKDVMAKGAGKSRHGYMTKLITEICEQRQVVSYHDKNMDAGIEKEPEAREYYAKCLTTLPVSEVGFIKLDDSIGCSPDGLVGDDGMLEIKCPLETTHTDYLEGKQSPVKTYKAQVQGQLHVTGRKWCDVLSYRPENKSRRHFLERVYRDEDFIYDLKVELILFVNEMKKRLENITKNQF